MTKLLPCPFCGNKPRPIKTHFQPNGDKQFSIGCAKICCVVKHKGLNNTIKRWNTRALQPANPAIYNWLNAHIKPQDLKTHPEWIELKRLLGVQDDK